MTLLTTDQITQQIVNQLKLLDPAVSAEVGTPERKIIEATAELISGQQVDFTVLNQQTDLSSLSGGRLDAYLSVYNFGRQQATPSFGTVAFSRATPATAAIVIPQGTQVIANIDDTIFPSLTFVTTQTVVLAIGATEVSSPAQCTIGGTIGNIDANKIVGFGGLVPISGFSTISNDAAFTGGTDQEDDATYVTRFKNTFLRNIAGTDDQYLALAVSLNGITKANVVGPISRYQEYMQVPASDDAKQVAASYDTGTSRGTVTVTIASPAVFTLTSHGLQVNDVIYLHTTSALPTGLVANTQYYVISAGLSANNFRVSATQGGLVVNTSGSQSGTHTLFKAIFPHKRTSAKSTIPYSKYTYPANFFLTDGTLDPATARFFRQGVDYIFNAPPWNGTTGAAYSVPPYAPNVTFLNPYDATFNASGDAGLASGNVLLLEHAYMSKNSRNDPTYGILNCIDVFINGENSSSVNSIEVVPTSSNYLQNSNTALWTYQPASPTLVNFRRRIDGVASVLGNMIQPLYWQPVLDVPDDIVIGSDTYYKANFFRVADSTYYNQYDPTEPTNGGYSFPAHYIVVDEVNSYYGTIRSRGGIEWFLSGNNYLNGQITGDPPIPLSGSDYGGAGIDTLTGTQFSLPGYSYDRNVSDLQAIMEQNKQTTADVLVHKARLRYFRPIVTIMYTLGATQSVVNASIIAALENYFETQYYGTAIQLSDILQLIHNVPGVDNVRWTNQGTAAVEEVNADGSSFSVPSLITTDFYIQDNELATSPSDNEVTITVRAQNTFGS